MASADSRRASRSSTVNGRPNNTPGVIAIPSVSTDVRVGIDETLQVRCGLQQGDSSAPVASELEVLLLIDVASKDKEGQMKLKLSRREACDESSDGSDASLVDDDEDDTVSSSALFDAVLDGDEAHKLIKSSASCRVLSSSSVRGSDE
jgi:hypothetical protein